MCALLYFSKLTLGIHQEDSLYLIWHENKMFLHITKCVLKYEKLKAD